MIRIYALYEPLKVFMTGALLVGLGRDRGVGPVPSGSTATAPATCSR